MAYNSYQSAPPIIPNPGSSSGTGTRIQLEDTTFTKVFVGGLAWETQSHTLRRHFEQFGDILEAVVITDKNTGRSKGYGFVTYFDPESARQACVDPSPIIDGRRTNCNLASLGRPNPSLAYGRMMPVSPSFGSLQSPRSAYGGSPGYRPISYSYQPGSTYPPYGYSSYGPEYVYPQGVYNPYIGQQYMPIYGVPGMYPYGQWRQPVPGGQGYSGHQGFAMSGHHIMQVGRPNMNGTSPTNFSSFQAPYAIGVASPNSGQPPIILRAPPPPPSQTAQDNSSDQMLDGSLTVCVWRNPQARVMPLPHAYTSVVICGGFIIQDLPPVEEPLDCSWTRSIRDPTSVTGLLSFIASYCLCILEVVTVHGHGLNKKN